MTEKMSDLYKHKETKQALVTEKPRRQTKPTVFSPALYKKHQYYFRIFLIISIYGLVDIATYKIIYTAHELSDTGIISFYIGILFGLITPILGGVIMTLLNFISSFTILWIGITVYEYSRLKKLEKVKLQQ